MEREKFLSKTSHHLYLIPKSGEIALFGCKLYDANKFGKYHKNTDVMKIIFNNPDAICKNPPKNLDITFSMSLQQETVNNIRLFSRAKSDSNELFDTIEMFNFAIEAHRRGVSQFVKELFYEGNTDVCSIILNESSNKFKFYELEIIKILEQIAPRFLTQYELNDKLNHAYYVRKLEIWK